MKFLILLSLVLVGCPAASPAMAGQDAPAPLRVCADPNNAPFSARDQSGFEDAIARIVADDLGRPLEYVWWAQRRGFIRNTLAAGLCDVVIGAPAHRYDQALRTRPYYRSTYVAVTRTDRGLAITDLHDPLLRDLKIGVHLSGDSGASSPPALALAQLGLTANVRGFPISGDYSEAAPPQRLIKAVASGDIDIAIAWGPMAGPVAKASPIPLTVLPLRDAPDFAPLAFTFEIAMAVRRDDLPLRRQLQAALDRGRDGITGVLEQAGVPLLPLRQPVMEVAP